MAPLLLPEVLFLVVSPHMRIVGGMEVIRTISGRTLEEFTRSAAIFYVISKNTMLTPIRAMTISVLR